MGLMVRRLPAFGRQAKKLAAFFNCRSGSVNGKSPASSHRAAAGGQKQLKLKT
jgi:hypothetical protein